MEGVELELGDYVVPQYASNFAALFDELGEANEVQETFQVDSFKNIKGKQQSNYFSNLMKPTRCNYCGY